MDYSQAWNEALYDALGPDIRKLTDADLDDMAAQEQGRNEAQGIPPKADTLEGE